MVARGGGVPSLNANKITAGVLARARLLTSLASGSTAVSANSAGSVSVGALSDGIHVLAWDARISGSSLPWMIGSAVTQTEAVEAQLHSFVERHGDGSTSDILSLINGTGTSRTADWEVFEIGG